MTASLGAVVGGALAGLGVAIAAAEILAPSRVDLTSALARLHPTALTAPPAFDDTSTRPQPVARLVAAVAGRVPLPASDLRLLEHSGDRFVASKLALAAYGALLPALLTGVLAIIGVHAPIVLPVAACVVIAAALFFAPDLVVRSQAQEARARFRRAVGCYLDLIALERGADGGPAEALTRAAAVGQGREFRRISDALVAARLLGATPWQALSDLAAEVGVEELADLADVIALAGDDGAAVADTLAAKAAALRTRQLAESSTAANAASEKLTLPGVVLAFGFLVLVCYPALARVLGHA
jgi:pilus assembly protein TadC